MGCRRRVDNGLRRQSFWDWVQKHRVDAEVLSSGGSGMGVEVSHLEQEAEGVVSVG